VALLRAVDGASHTVSEVRLFPTLSGGADRPPPDPASRPYRTTVTGLGEPRRTVGRTRRPAAWPSRCTSGEAAGTSLLTSSERTGQRGRNCTAKP